MAGIRRVSRSPLPVALVLAWGLSGVLASADEPLDRRRWRPAGFPGVLHLSTAPALAVDPTMPSRIYLASNAGLFRSSDSGATWTSASAGLPPGWNDNRLLIDPLNPATLYLVQEGNGIFGGPLFRSENFGDDWRRLADGGFNGPIVLDPVRVSTLYMLEWLHGLCTSADAGETWSTPVDLAPELDLFDKRFSALSIDATHPDVLLVGTEGFSCHAPGLFGCDIDARMRIFRSPDRGRQWHEAAGLPRSTAYRVNAIVPDRLTGSTYALLSRTSSEPVTSQVWKSVDQGEHWQRLSPSVPGFAFSLVVDPTFASTLYLATTEGILESIDGGATWFEMNDGLPDPADWSGGYLGGIESAGDHLFATTLDGVWILDRVISPRTVVPAFRSVPVVVTPP